MELVLHGEARVLARTVEGVGWTDAELLGGCCSRVAHPPFNFSCCANKDRARRVRSIKLTDLGGTRGLQGPHLPLQ